MVIAAKERVSCKIGGLIPGSQAKARVYGVVLRAAGSKRWWVQFEDRDGETEVASSRLKREPNAAGLPAAALAAAEVPGGAAAEAEDEEGNPDLEEEEAEDGRPGFGELALEGADVHKEKRAQWKAKIATLVGTKVTVTNSGKSLDWEVVGAETVTDDDFPSSYGPKKSWHAPGGGGTPARTAKRRHIQGGNRALLNHNIVEGKDMLLRTWMHLYPGDLEADVARVNLQGHAKYRNWVDLTVGEWVRFIGMLHAATLYTQSGAGLFSKSCRGLREAPNFGRWIPQRRFEDIRATAHFAFADMESTAQDPWGWFRPVVERFNANRKVNVKQDPVFVGDESMSEWQPRSTALGGLPNLSFIKRKPKPLGTEFKNICDAAHGMMLYLEIQEGKVRMREKPFSKELGGNAGCAVRFTLGAMQ